MICGFGCCPSKTGVLNQRQRLKGAPHWACRKRSFPGMFAPISGVSQRAHLVLAVWTQERQP